MASLVFGLQPITAEHGEGKNCQRENKGEGQEQPVDCGSSSHYLGFQGNSSSNPNILHTQLTKQIILQRQEKKVFRIITSSVTREMQIKTTISNYFIHTRGTIIQNK